MMKRPKEIQRNEKVLKRKGYDVFVNWRVHCAWHEPKIPAILTICYGYGTHNLQVESINSFDGIRPFVKILRNFIILVLLVRTECHFKGANKLHQNTENTHSKLETKWTIKFEKKKWESLTFILARGSFGNNSHPHNNCHSWWYANQISNKVYLIMAAKRIFTKLPNNQQCIWTVPKILE